MDLNAEVKRGVPLWNETRWNGCWSPAAGAGLYIHTGRFRSDLDIWWAQTVAYLPDGQLSVDRSWGRNSQQDRVTTGSFELRLTESGWHSTFDGAGELTSIDALARAPRGCSAPFVPMRWEVAAEPTAPEWSLYGDGHNTHSFAGDRHVQQGFRTTGTLTVAGTTYDLSGVGFKDHSSGVRDWAGWGSHWFILAVMPTYTFHAFSIVGADGTARPLAGTYFRDGVRLGINAGQLPPMTDPTGAPVLQELILKPSRRAPETLRAELIHGLPMTITAANDNINGIDWETPHDPVVLVEGIGRFSDAEGQVGYGFLERSALRSALRRPL